MRIACFKYGLVALCAAVSGLQPLHADVQQRLLEQLSQTRPVNMEAIVDGQFEQPESNKRFRMADPYAPEVAVTVERWASNPNHLTQVCAVRFIDAQQVEYELGDFTSASAAAEAGFMVTHQGRCGSCSSLQDLAVYLAVPDLTTPARECARRFGLKRKKQCFQQQLGLTPQCAESWAYNARNTRHECMEECAADYGFLNILFGRFPEANVDEQGRLRPCLQCDEDKSGRGFKYSAGRTRRNSGIESAIDRPDPEIYPMDHDHYFRNSPGLPQSGVDEGRGSQ